jgi:hypothetical protein
MTGMLDLGMLILKGLAVAGGAAVGGLGSGLLFRLLVRLSLHRTVPQKALLLVRALGAAALGLAVWMWVFSTGGSGPGLGGLLGSGAGGQSTETRAQPGPSTEPTPKHQAATPKGSIPESRQVLAPDTMRIEILGGERVKQERFYLLEGEKEPRTLSEVRKAILARREDRDKPPLVGIVIMIYGSSVARDHPAVRNLQKWAEENRLSVTFPPTNGAAL